MSRRADTIWITEQLYWKERETIFSMSVFVLPHPLLCTLGVCEGIPIGVETGRYSVLSPALKPGRSEPQAHVEVSLLAHIQLLFHGPVFLRELPLNLNIGYIW